MDPSSDLAQLDLEQLAEETANRLDLPIVQNQPSRKYWHLHPHDVLYSRMGTNTKNKSELLAVRRERKANCKIHRYKSSQLLLVQIAVPHFDERLAGLHGHRGDFASLVVKELTSGRTTEDWGDTYYSSSFQNFTTENLKELFSALFYREK